MKKTKIVAMIIFMGLIALSCKKEVEGPQGTAGKDGKDGNANVTMLAYGSQTFNNGNSYFKDFTLTGITSSKCDSSMFVAYYLASGFGMWYTIGQLGPGYSYQSRGSVDNFYIPNYRIALASANGAVYAGPDVVWDSVRIFVVPATTFTTAINQNVNFDDYKAVSNYFDKK